MLPFVFGGNSNYTWGMLTKKLKNEIVTRTRPALTAAPPPNRVTN